jgi:hypothetical protein
MDPDGKPASRQPGKEAGYVGASKKNKGTLVSGGYSGIPGTYVNRATGKATVVPSALSAPGGPPAGSAPIANKLVSLVDSSIGNKYGIFNPPPHATTTTSLTVTGKVGQVSTKTGYGEVDTRGKFAQLGFIFQEPNPANAVNAPGGSAAGRGGQQGKMSMSQLWGFRFMYNPASIVHSMGLDPTIDATLADPATQLSGTGTIQFELLLNRIIDVAILAKGGHGPLDYPGFTLSTPDILGILNRGTAYDLDFLYRVINGDPVRSSPQMLDAGWTSDFGYMIGSPVWVHFSRDQRFRGIIQSLTVSHGMFSPNMVPLLTTVSVTMGRLPVISTDSTESDAKYAQANAYIPKSSGQDNTDNTTP